MKHLIHCLILGTLIFATQAYGQEGKKRAVKKSTVKVIYTTDIKKHKNARLPAALPTAKKLKIADSESGEKKVVEVAFGSPIDESDVEPVLSSKAPARNLSTEIKKNDREVEPQE